MTTMTQSENGNIAIITPYHKSMLSGSVAAEVEAATTRIKDRLSRLVPDIIETGRDLQEVKDKLEHGQFKAWLSASFNMTTRTAQKYMRAAALIGDKSELSSYLTANTIYLLSVPSTPESVQQKVIDAVNSGDAPKPAEVRDMVLEAKEQKRQERTKEQRRKDGPADVPREIEKNGGKSRRTSAEIRLDNFDHAIQTVSNICSGLAMLEVPNLDSERQSRALADLRNAGKHIQDSIKTIQHAQNENQAA